jgi:signal transduction histidine kinase
MDPDGLRFIQEILTPAVTRIGQGYSGITAQTGRTLLVPEVAQEQVRSRVNPEAWPYLERYGVHSVLITPIKIDDRVVGTLGVTRDKPGRPYTTDDQLFLEAIAGRAAQWIANAGLYEEVRKELAERRRIEAELKEIQRRLLDAAEGERLQLARELHDGPIQDLYGLEFQLHALGSALPAGEDNEELAALQASIQRIIDSLRMMTMELRPPTLTRVGLGAAIRSHCDAIEKLQNGLEVTYKVDSEKPPAPQISERVRLALFRIVQVALTNVIRHAQAKSVRVVLEIRENEVELVVADDGIGFNAPTRWVELARQGHLGLLGAKERVDALGGTFEVRSREGEGTTIRVVVPREG